mgnify:CR=1 FL=1
MLFRSGRLGFLTETVEAEAEASFAEVLQGHARLERHAMVQARIGEGEPMHALNDVVINKGASGRMLELLVNIDGEFVYDMRSDGLIIATPTGSTAYSLGAGGPIMFPTMRGVILAPICPHTLSNRSVVVSLDAVVRVRALSRSVETVFTGDGQDTGIGVGLFRIHGLHHTQACPWGFGIGDNIGHETGRSGMSALRCVVLGAGLMGRLMAFALAKQGHQVEVHEAQGSDAMGAAARIAAAMLAPLAESAITETSVVRMGHHSIGRWQNLLADLPEPVFSQRNGSLIVWHRQDAPLAKQFEQMLRQTGQIGRAHV